MKIECFSSRLLLLIFLCWNNVVACINETNQNPLIVTPFLDKGQSKKARELSKVDIGDLKSYSGYFTVDKECGSNMFFWFILAEKDPSKAAVLLWLQGGPGSSSMFGLFQENGPWMYKNKTGLKRRDFPWTKKHNVLYLDQPPGTGFSFSNKNCFPKTLTGATELVTIAINQFFSMFPKFQNSKFFLTGESYAGHSIPPIAVEIDKHIANGTKINLVGIIIGSPFLDYKCINPLTVAYQWGIIDNKDLEEGTGYFNSFVKAVNDKNFTDAEDQITQVYAVIDDGALASLYNVLYDREVDNEFVQYLNEPDTKKKLHVGSLNFSAFNEPVYNALWPNDGYVSIAPSLEYLLNSDKYIVGFYAGQLDLVCPYTSLTCTLESLQWSGISQYLNATRKPWYFSERLAGWVKVTGNLFEVAIRNSGHYGPRDQGEAVLELLSAAVADVPGSPLLTKLDYGSPDNSTTINDTRF